MNTLVNHPAPRALRWRLGLTRVSTLGLFSCVVSCSDPETSSMTLPELDTKGHGGTPEVSSSVPEPEVSSSAPEPPVASSPSMTAVDPTLITAPNADSGDAFGSSVALSRDGSTLAVGADGEASGATGIDGDPKDNSLAGAGAVYVYAHRDDTWQPEAYIKAANSGAGDSFGSSVALSADGSTLVVGALYEASSATGVEADPLNDEGVGVGAVYVFVREASGFRQQAYIKASNGDDNDLFGQALALSADGNTLVVGAEGEDGGSTGVDGDQTDKRATSSGAVYVFSRSGSQWQQDAYLKSSNSDANDHFGGSVALSSDATTLVVGAYREDSVATEVNGNQLDNSVLSVGAAYVFVRDTAQWQQQAYLKPAGHNAEGFDGFGVAVSVSADGAVVAVGAAGEASDATGVDGERGPVEVPYSGAVYVFSRTATTWERSAYLKASNAGQADEFGRRIQLSDSGELLAVGAALESNSAAGINPAQDDNARAESGAAYLFRRQAQAWTEQAYVKAPSPAAGARFGWAVALSSDGANLAVGALNESSAASSMNPEPTSGANVNTGAAYVYRNAASLPDVSVQP